MDNRPKPKPKPKAPAKYKQVPITLWERAKEAIRTVERDTRRDDRALKDTTRDMVTDVNDAITDWQDGKTSGKET